MTTARTTAADPQFPRAHARRNHAKLIDTAATVFTEQGTDAPLDVIAQRAGVGNATLYRHFPSRETLIEAVLRERVTQLLDSGAPLLKADNPVRALATYLEEFVDYTRTYQGLPASVMTTLRGDPGAPLYEACHTILATATRLLKRAQKTDAVRGDVDATDVLIQATAIAWAAERGPHDNSRAGRLVTILMDGLQVRPRTPTKAGQVSQRRR